jgi:maltose alpha-D-glucosyltransferase/alpha-amylase
MDAVPFVIATKGPKVGKPEEQYDMLRAFREFLQWRQGDCIILAEANVLPDTDMEYFGDDGERMHMMFNFQVNQHLFYALASADTRPLTKAMIATKKRPATAQWGLFLRNHDELDLGRLTEEQRQTVLRGVRAGQEHAALRSGHPAAAGANARWRPPAHRACLQPLVHAARHTRHSLRDELGMGDDLVSEGAQIVHAPRCNGRTNHAAASQA